MGQADLEVREALDRILASRVFARSTRLSRFLRFVVEKALQGKFEELKESVIAMEVFDRKPDYDSRIDSVVRVEARRLRAKLKEYYAGDGSGDPIVLEIPEGSYVPRWKAGARRIPPAQPRPSVAVLPFTNLSSDPEQEYFCEGVTEEIITMLSRLPGLAVTARTSTFRFRNDRPSAQEVGERLGAAVLVEGSVRRAGERVRITTQVVDAKTGYQLACRSLDGSIEDVFAMQERVAAAVAECVASACSLSLPPVTALDPGANADAFTLYLKGRYHWNRQTIDGFRKAEELFRACIEKYPAYARPYAGLADCYCMLATFGAERPASAALLIHEAARQAIALDPALAEPYNALAGTSSFYEWNWQQGERFFRKAIELQPGYALAHHWYALHLAALGRLEEARQELDWALRLDPLSPSVHTSLALVAYYRRRYEEAASELAQAFDLDPDFPAAWELMGRVRMMQGRLDDALACLEKAAPCVSAALSLGWTGGVYARRGQAEKVVEILGKLEALPDQDSNLAYARAVVFTGLGDADNAFVWLKRAASAHAVLLSWLGVDPYFDTLRLDPRFEELRERIGLK